MHLKGHLRTLICLLTPAERCPGTAVPLRRHFRRWCGAQGPEGSVDRCDIQRCPCPRPGSFTSCADLLQHLPDVPPGSQPDHRQGLTDPDAEHRVPENGGWQRDGAALAVGSHRPIGPATRGAEFRHCLCQQLPARCEAYITRRTACYTLRPQYG